MKARLIAFVSLACLWGSLAYGQIGNYRVIKVDGAEFDVQSYTRKDPNFHFLDMKGRRIVRSVVSIARIFPLKGEDIVYVSEPAPGARHEAVAIASATLPASASTAPPDPKLAAGGDSQGPGFRVVRSGSEFFATSYSHKGDWIVFVHPEGHRSQHLAESIEAIERLTTEQAAKLLAKIASPTGDDIDARTTANTTARVSARTTARTAAKWDAFNRSMQGAAQLDSAIGSQMQTLQSPSYGSGFGGFGPDGRAKTVHVNGYTRSNGTYVNSYWRRPPSR